MHQGNQLKLVKFDKDNQSQLEFLKKNVRDFYSRDIVIWQYENGNFSTGLYFAQKDDCCISSQGMIPIYLCVKGKRTLTAKSESSFLLPDFRGKGIFEELYFYTIETSEQDGVEIIWGFTALSNVWRKKLKFDVYEGLIHESELQIRFFKSLLSVWSSNQPVVRKMRLSLKTIIALSKGKKLTKTNKDYTADIIDIKDDTKLKLILKLYEEWSAKYPNLIHIHVDEEYFNWRIANNPVVNYKVIGVFKNQKLVGIGIVNDTSNKAYLLDFIVPEKEHLNQCLVKIIKHLKESGSVTHLIYWASHKNDYTSTIHSIFQSQGAYCYINNNMNFVIKKTNKCTMENIDLEDLYINGLWTEGFRI